MDIDDLLRQPSTWTGIIALLANLAGWTVGGETLNILAGLASSVAGLYLIVIRERRTAPPPPVTKPPPQV